MSINLTYRRVPHRDFILLLEGSRDVIHYWFGDLEDESTWEEHDAQLNADERFLDIGKAWHALHFLLTGESRLEGESEVEPPLCNVVMGGNPTEMESSYGVVHYLIHSEVHDVAQFLLGVNREDLAQRFHSADFATMVVYPPCDSWDEDDLTWILLMFDKVRSFFHQADTQSQAVLLSFD